jgi:ArsR family transcriptional regulator, zinc-responsive transcriptional repressor
MMVSTMHKKQSKSSNDDVDRNAAVRNGGFPVRCQLNNDRVQSAAFLAKSLSDNNRLRILLLISRGKKSVSTIVEELDLSQPLVSHHLKELRRSLLVRVEREGSFIYYELADSRILDILRTLSDIATDLLSDRKTF